MMSLHAGIMAFLCKGGGFRTQKESTIASLMSRNSHYSLFPSAVCLFEQNGGSN